jgi:hypothetical protein
MSKKKIIKRKRYVVEQKRKSNVAKNNNNIVIRIDNNSNSKKTSKRRRQLSKPKIQHIPVIRQYTDIGNYTQEILNRNNAVLQDLKIKKDETEAKSTSRLPTSTAVPATAPSAVPATVPSAMPSIIMPTPSVVSSARQPFLTAVSTRRLGESTPVKSLFQPESSPRSPFMDSLATAKFGETPTDTFLKTQLRRKLLANPIKEEKEINDDIKSIISNDVVEGKKTMNFRGARPLDDLILKPIPELKGILKRTKNPEKINAYQEAIEVKKGMEDILKNEKK